MLNVWVLLCFQLLLDHQDAIAPEHNDPIHELLEDLGEVPTVESLIGESCGSDGVTETVLCVQELSMISNTKYWYCYRAL